MGRCQECRPHPVDERSHASLVDTQYGSQEPTYAPRTLRTPSSHGNAYLPTARRRCYSRNFASWAALYATWWRLRPRMWHDGRGYATAAKLHDVPSTAQVGAPDDDALARLQSVPRAPAHVLPRLPLDGPSLPSDTAHAPSPASPTDTSNSTRLLPKP